MIKYRGFPIFVFYVIVITKFSNFTPIFTPAHREWLNVENAI